MKTLIVDTSSTAASVAALVDDKVVGSFYIATDQTHSQKLMPMIDALLTSVDMNIQMFDQFAVCEGPGSFTGVRIGIATVKAFAHPKKLPIYTFNSMQLVAAAHFECKGHVLALVDAKKGQVYYGLYRWMDGKLHTVLEGTDALRDALKVVLEHCPSGEITVAGDGLMANDHEVREAMAKFEGKCFYASEPSLEAVHARHLLPQLLPQSYGSVKANYMKKSQAERDLR